MSIMNIFTKDSTRVNNYNMDRTYCNIIAVQGNYVRERHWQMLRNARQLKEQKEGK